MEGSKYYGKVQIKKKKKVEGEHATFQEGTYSTSSRVLLTCMHTGIESKQHVDGYSPNQRLHVHASQISISSCALFTGWMNDGMTSKSVSSNFIFNFSVIRSIFQSK